jgi:hypothetical protein
MAIPSRAARRNVCPVSGRKPSGFTSILLLARDLFPAIAVQIERRMFRVARLTSAQLGVRVELLAGAEIRRRLGSGKPAT